MSRLIMKPEYKTSKAPKGTTVGDVKRRLKSTSKNGQSTKARADESKGKRKAELNKISKVDKKNFQELKKKDPAKAKRIANEYKKKKGNAKEKNKGKYI